MQQHYCLRCEGENRCRLQVFAQINFRKPPWGFIKSMIEKNMHQGVTEYVADLQKALDKEVERLVSDSGRIPPPLTLGKCFFTRCIPDHTFPKKKPIWWVLSCSGYKKDSVMDQTISTTVFVSLCTVHLVMACFFLLTQTCKPLHRYHPPSPRDKAVFRPGATTGKLSDQMLLRGPLGGLVNGLTRRCFSRCWL